MAGALVTVLDAADDAARAVELAELEEQARAFAHDSRAASTWRTYASDVADFRTWCAERVAPVEPLPATPATVVLYITAVAAKGLKPSTIRRRLASISVAHQVAGFQTPTTDARVRAVWSGIRRHHGTAPRKVRAARTRSSRRWWLPSATAWPTPGTGRCCCSASPGRCGAASSSPSTSRTSARTTPGLRLVVRRSKTDQEADGTVRGLPYGSHPATCPVRAWRGWLTASGIPGGPAFRSVDRHGRLGANRLSDRAVADMIKRRALAAGLDGDFAGHSLRAGFATEGYAQGTPEPAIMRHGRWRSASVMRGYVEEGSLWNDNAAARLGL